MSKLCFNTLMGLFMSNLSCKVNLYLWNLFIACYDIKPVRKEEGKSYWKIPLCDDDATREK